MARAPFLLHAERDSLAKPNLSKLVFTCYCDAHVTAQLQMKISSVDNSSIRLFMSKDNNDTKTNGAKQVLN